MKYFSVNYNDIQNITITEATDDNKVRVFLKDYSLTFTLTDLVYTDFKAKLIYLKDYINQEGIIIKQNTNTTNVNYSAAYLTTELTDVYADYSAQNLYMFFTATRAGADYIYFIYLNKELLENMVENYQAKMINTIWNESLTSIANIGGIPTEYFVQFTTSGGSVLKVYIQDALYTDVTTDVGTENTAMQATDPVTGEYLITQTASNIHSINVRNDVLEMNTITNFELTRTSTNMSVLNFSGIDADNCERNIQVILNRDSILMLYNSI